MVRRNLWELDALGQRYGQRPSSFLGLEPTGWAAYQVDMAALTLGRWVDARLAERDKQGRPVHRLATLLMPPETKGSGFRALAKPGLPKVRINADGTW